MADSSGCPTPKTPKPEEPIAPHTMSIKIKDQTESKVFFKVKPTTKLGKVFKAYGDRQSIDIDYIRFLFHGTRVQPDQTAADLEMVEGDELQTMVEQQGGDGTPAPAAPVPEAPGEEQALITYLNVKVIDQSQNEVFFKIKWQTPLKKIMDAYCARQGIERTAVRFLLEGERIVDNDTPTSKEMEDGDMIQVVTEQQGGDGTPAPDAPGEEPATPTTHLNVRVVDQSRNELFFKIRMQTSLKKVMNAYCERQGIDRLAVRFVVEGERINDDDTPASKEMEDNDTIEVFREQLGGNDDDGDGQDKPKDEAKPAINLRIADQAGNDTTFRVKYTTKMEKVMNEYSIRQGQTLGALRFFTPDGRRILPTDTPTSLDLEDEDVVDVHLHQLGGGPDGEDAPMDESAKSIMIKVRDRRENEATYKVKPTTMMGKVMDAFAQQYRHPPEYLRFLSQGNRIAPRDTVDFLGLEDGATIEVHFQQGGPYSYTGVPERPFYEQKVSHEVEHNVETRMTLTVKHEKNETTFKVKPTTLMEKVMVSYCDQVGKNPDAFRFFTLDGKRIQKLDTPAMLGLEDGDQLDAHLEQEGGGSPTPIKKGNHPVPVDTGEYVTFFIQDSHGMETWYRIKTKTRMERVIKYQCRRVKDFHLDFFTVDGTRIHNADTPRSLRLTEGGFIRSAPMGMQQLEYSLMSSLSISESDDSMNSDE